MNQKGNKKYISNYNIGLDKYLLNDKHNPNNYLYTYIRNGLNSSKNLKNNQNSSSNKFFGKNNNNYNKLDRSNNQISQKSSSDQISHIRMPSGPKLNYNKKIFNISNYNNKSLNFSYIISKNNIRTKSLPRDNLRIKTLYNNKNNINNFYKNKRTKTPLLKRNENNNNRSMHSKIKDNKMNKVNKNINMNIHEKNSFRNYNNIFQPINIFSQFKRNKISNNEDLANKNSQLFRKFLNEEQKQNISDNGNSNLININNKNIIHNNQNNLSTNIINKTNDTTPISSGNLLNNKSNSNQNLNINNKINNKIIFDNNIGCHEINFHVNGISSSINLKNNLKPKKKIFKGKKIKCMHDLSKTGLSGDDKKVNQDNYFIFKNFVQGFDYIFM